MLELGQLESHWQEFDKRNVRIVVVSIEGAEDAKATQADFPHLIVVSDSERKLSEAVEVIHQRSACDHGDTAAPTTLLIDGDGVVRWTFRPDRVFTRLSITQAATAIDEKMPAK